VNQMTGDDGELSGLARQAIGGILHYGETLAAFGNTVPASYLRLVPGHESPTSLFWSDLNRAALIRVPLGWRKGEDMASIINHRLKDRYISPFKRQTIEIRSADGSAHVHLFLTALVAAIDHGIAHPEAALALARERQVKKGERGDGIPALPADCATAADLLEEHRDLYSAWIVDHLLDWLIQDLRDKQRAAPLPQAGAKGRRAALQAIMHREIDIG
jgi:Glutamine synthetase